MNWILQNQELVCLSALLDALERKRAVFFTGNVLVEFDRDLVPEGQVTMVLDKDDFETLMELKRNVERRRSPVRRDGG